MFEQILFNHLLSCDDLEPYLTKYAGRPAIFNQRAPDDMDEAWDDKQQYNRAVFFVNMQADAEHEISGTMEIDIHLTNSNPEEVAEIVKNNVDSYFFNGERDTVFAKWSATRYFDEPDNKVTVAAVLFSLIAFPTQLSVEPDPIAAVNNWTRNLLPQVKLIGFDNNLPAVWKPDKENFAVYWRKASVIPCERIPSTYAGNWYTVKMNAHIFTADKQMSNAIASLILRKLNEAKILKFPDDTWMRIDNNNQIQPNADELRIGQLSVEGDYCILRDSLDTELLNNIIVNE